MVKECFFQVGIRSAGNREAREYVGKQGGMIFTARELRGLENKQQLAPVMQKIIGRMDEHRSPPIYLSFDIDALDPTFAPGTLELPCLFRFFSLVLQARARPRWEG